MFAKDDVDFIKRRLEGTFISCDGEPVYVTNVARFAITDVIVSAIKIKDDEELDYKLDQLDFRPVNLGYINRPRHHASWMCRAPIRAWQQGLSRDNVVFSGDAVDLWDNRKYLRDTILGVYPTIDVADKSTIKKAFSKDFAIYKGDIYYKDFDVVGSYNKGNVTLHDRYLYLREYLQEVLG